MDFDQKLIVLNISLAILTNIHNGDAPSNIPTEDLQLYYVDGKSDKSAYHCFVCQERDHLGDSNQKMLALDVDGFFHQKELKLGYISRNIHRTHIDELILTVQNIIDEDE